MTVPRPSGIRVGLVAPPWVAVPPVGYGGTELVVDHLARGLTAAGCEVVLFTTGDSTCPVERRWALPRALGTAPDPAAESAHVAAAYEALTDVDVIHDHTAAGPLLAAAGAAHVPVVATVHSRLQTPDVERYRAVAASGVRVVAISHAQLSSAPDLPAVVIHHGIDLADFPMGSGTGGFVLFLGRMDTDKGAHRAIAAARAAGVPIVVAAKVREPDEHRYFAEQVEPLLGPGVSWVGEVGGACKLDLLARAAALVNPIRWPEPFGLVMVEALACGTPVLAFPEGAAPEIVEHGRSGFLCDDVSDLARAITRVRELDRAACRARVAAAFTTERMVQDHLRLYRELVDASMQLPSSEEGATDGTHQAIVG